MADEMLGRRLNRRKFVTTSAALPAALGAVATVAGGTRAAPAAQTQTSASLKVARMNTTQNVGPHFNPLWFIATGSQWHSFPFIWLPLVFYNAEGQMEPWLAEKVDVSPDAKVFTFTLPANAVWSDGTPITAADVKFSYELLTNPETTAIGNPGAYNLKGIVGIDAYLAGDADNISGIEAVDDHTVRFTLTASNALFIYDCWAFIMPKHILEKIAIKDLPNDPYIDNPTVTSGPFKLGKYEPQQYIQLDAWPEYWGAKKPKIDRLVLVQADGPSVMNMLESGELDFGVYLSTDNAARIEQMKSVKPIYALSAGVSSLYVNGRRDFLQDPRIRQAMLYAINRGPLNDLLYAGKGTPINSEIIGPDWAISPNLNPYDYDPDKAKQLLQEAGWDSSRTLTYWTTSSDDAQAVYIQDAFNSVGIKVEINTEAFSAVVDAYSSDKFELSATSGGLMALDPDFASQRLLCGSYWGELNNYCNKELDNLFAEGAATTDQKERQKIYWQASEIINKDMPFVELFRPPTAYAVSDRLTGLVAPISFRFANTSLLDWDVTG